MMKAKMIYLLTEEGRAYSDDGIAILKDEIKELFNDDSNMLVSMGSHLNDPENLAKALDRNDGSGYLVVSMPVGGGYFTGKEMFTNIAKVIRHNADKNPWEVMAYVVEKREPGQHGYTPPREITW